MLTPPQEEDSRVRQTIDGHPIVIFWDNGSETKFLSKYNFNHDKGTEEVFGFKSGDESWEILQNGTERTGFRSADFSGSDWKNDFEARYPEDNINTTKLAAFAAWLVSTNSAAATNTALATAVTYGDVEYTTDSAEYRLAKFKAELATHANVSAMVFYYVITELFLCIDQREKNAFPTLWKDDPRWMMLFYDADSSLGIDNKGNLAFDYYLEDIDYTEGGDPVFNGQASVLWVNLRKCFYPEIEAEYKRLRTTVRSDGSGRPLLSYDVVNDLFEAHQSKWSEAIYNEDGYRKAIEPYVLKGDTQYLPMLQGKKEQQRKWWLYNRFRYLDSKYVTGTSMDTRIIIRAKAKGNVTLTSYVNMYGHVYYNSEMVEHRMYRGEEQEFVWAATGAEDAVIGINDSDMLTSLGDLAPLMVETINVSNATHLTDLKVGDAASTYDNKNLKEITLGNNTLLQTIDLRNCSNLAQAVNAAGCTNIEEIYLDGTATTGVSLPNGGALRVLHLPATVKNLSICNHKKLEDFVLPNPAGITTLRLENNSDVVDPLALFNAMGTNNTVRLVGFDWEMTDSEFGAFITKLDTMRGLDENGVPTDLAQLSGRIYVPQIGAKNVAAAEKYVGLNLLYDEIVLNSAKLVERTLSGDYVNERVTTVGPAAFANMSTEMGLLSLPNVTTMGEYTNNGSKCFAFANMASVDKVSLPLVTNIGVSAFEYAKIAEFDLSSVTSVGGAGFYSLKGCAQLRLPSVTTIGGNVFQYAGYASWGGILTALILPGDTVCALSGTIGWSGHNFNNGGKGYFYVPRALVDTYKAATNWSNYADQFRALEDYTVDGTVNGELDESKI